MLRGVLGYSAMMAGRRDNDNAVRIGEMDDCVNSAERTYSGMHWISKRQREGPQGLHIIKVSFLGGTAMSHIQLSRIISKPRLGNNAS